MILSETDLDIIGDARSPTGAWYALCSRGEARQETATRPLYGWTDSITDTVDSTPYY